MNELIEVNYDSGKPTVSGRKLHEVLKIKTPYTQWFDRMCEYGFKENVDYTTLHKNVKRADGVEMPEPQTDHEISLDMAKEIRMIQRSEIGKRFREYFIAVEKAWNDPVLIMGRAYEAQKAITEKLNAQVLQLEGTVAVQVQQVSELQPKVMFLIVLGLAFADFVTGYIKAKCADKVSSKAMRIGGLYKIAELVIMGTAIGLTVGLDMLGRYYNDTRLTDIAGMFTALSVFVYIVAMELISIIVGLKGDEGDDESAES
jgi:phage anti-repressor protein/phage-related holin